MKEFKVRNERGEQLYVSSLNEERKNNCQKSVWRNEGRKIGCKENSLVVVRGKEKNNGDAEYLWYRSAWPGIRKETETPNCMDLWVMLLEVALTYV